ASEERPDVIDVGEGVSVALDPLDGSTNLKPNNVMGTLYSVYDEPLPTGGENLLAAGYILYGPVTTLVAARDGVVSEYILESGVKRPLREEL
ncbi:class 1 fructose-bisphosphatase, partial [Salinisphaera sp. USBA-960]|nr:class 1 fructose-bisphosphatase [Salifodinibacter halophilus]